jgi:hypothetical protein
MQALNIHLVQGVTIGDVVEIKGPDGSFKTKTITVVDVNGATTDINLFLAQESDENE